MSADILIIIVLAFFAAVALVGWQFASQDAAMYKKLYHDEHKAFNELANRALQIIDEWEASDARAARGGLPNG